MNDHPAVRESLLGVLASVEDVEVVEAPDRPPVDAPGAAAMADPVAADPAATEGPAGPGDSALLDPPSPAGGNGPPGAAGVDVVVIDVGVDLARTLENVQHVRDRFGAVRIIAMTAMPNPIAADRLRQVGVEAVLDKTGPLEPIIRAIRGRP
ncbi:MAG: hypothetical protein WD316_07370 [Phycisphaeraceae bacterium]